jgi:hypothetical protein
VQVPVLLIEDRKKIIDDIEHLKLRVFALANGTAAPAPVLISPGISYFFDYNPLEEYTLSTIVPDAKFIVCRIRAIGHDRGDIKTTGSLTSDEDFPE